MREFPSISDYNKAVENKFYQDRSNIFSPVLKQSGELHFEPGGRAVVYKVEDSTNNIKAIKLFTVNRDSLFQKYNQISKFIHNFTSSKYFVEFQFKEKLIYCSDINSDKNDNIFPGLIMEWAEGKTVGSIVKNLCEQNDKTSLKKLTEKFKKLSIFIIDSDFGHGDLKHDNIIVDSDFNVKLIDYDDMFIPEFTGNRSSELGTPSFQHPKRKSTDFNSDIDDFSILSIYTSLLALAKYPNLYEKYEDQQNLLFRLEDFENPHSSELFQFLDKDKELVKWSYLIKKSLANDHIYISELKDYLNGGFPKPSIKISHFPEKFFSGSEVELKWYTENTDEVLLNNKLVDTIGTLKVNVLPNSIFIFKLKNQFETIEIEHKVNVLPDLKIKEFSSKQHKIEFGKSTDLKWDIENAEKVNLFYDGKSEVIGNRGEKNIEPQKHTQYKIVATALDGITKIEQEVTVEVYSRIKIKSFTSNYLFVVASVPVTLNWDVENASEIILEDNLGNKTNLLGKSEFLEHIKQDTTYRVWCKNELFSETSEKLQVTVIQDIYKAELQNLVPRFDQIVPDIGKAVNLDYEFIPSINYDSAISFETIDCNLTIDHSDGTISTNIAKKVAKPKNIKSIVDKIKSYIQP